jgi:lysophospholipase L1-like esterase
LPKKCSDDGENDAFEEKPGLATAALRPSSGFDIGSSMKRLVLLALLVGAAVTALLLALPRKAPSAAVTPVNSAPAMAAVSSQPKSPTVPEAAHKKRVLLLGDSIAVGYAVSGIASTGYAPFVRANLANQAVVCWPAKEDGKPENCCGTGFGLENIDRWLQIEGGKWDVIHFNWGLHDIKHQTSEGKPSALETDSPQASLVVYEQQLKELVAKMKATGAKLIFATSTPVPVGKIAPWRSDADAVSYNEAALRVMKDNQVAVDDLYSIIKPRLPQLQQPSNIHFTKAGCQVLAAEVAKAIEKAL